MLLSDTIPGRPNKTNNYKFQFPVTCLVICLEVATNLFYRHQFEGDILSQTVVINTWSALNCREF